MVLLRWMLALVAEEAVVGHLKTHSEVAMEALWAARRSLKEEGERVCLLREEVVAALVGRRILAAEGAVVFRQVRQRARCSLEEAEQEGRCLMLSMEVEVVRPLRYSLLVEAEDQKVFSSLRREEAPQNASAVLTETMQAKGHSMVPSEVEVEVRRPCCWLPCSLRALVAARYAQACQHLQLAAGL